MDCVINVLHPIAVVALVFAAFVFGFFRGYKRKLTTEMLKMMKEVTQTMAARHESRIKEDARKWADRIINKGKKNGKNN